MRFAHVKKRTVPLRGLLGLAANPPVWAALPTPVAPSTAPAAGDWIALIQGYIKDGGLVLGLAIRRPVEVPAYGSGQLTVAPTPLGSDGAGIGLRLDAF